MHICESNDEGDWQRVRWCQLCSEWISSHYEPDDGFAYGELAIEDKDFAAVIAQDATRMEAIAKGVMQ
jgi:hypothetical protein